MVEKGIKELLNHVKSSENGLYPQLINEIIYLNEQRIKLTGNDLRKSLSLEIHKIDKKEIIDTFKRIGEIASKADCKIYLPKNWEETEGFLRLSVLDDLKLEFERQEN